jgi:hypothetical protein
MFVWGAKSKHQGQSPHARPKTVLGVVREGDTPSGLRPLPQGGTRAGVSTPYRRGRRISLEKIGGLRKTTKIAGGE